MFQKGHCVLQHCVSGPGFDLEKDEPHCRAEAVYVSIFPGLCLLLGWTCPAKNSSSPRQLCGQHASCLFNDSSALDTEWCLITVWRYYRSFPGRMSDWLGNMLLTFRAALQLFQAWFCKSFHLVQILDCEHRWSQRRGLFETPFKNLSSFQQINAAWVCEYRFSSVHATAQVVLESLRGSKIGFYSRRLWEKWLICVLTTNLSSKAFEALLYASAHGAAGSGGGWSGENCDMFWKRCLSQKRSFRISSGFLSSQEDGTLLWFSS